MSLKSGRDRDFQARNDGIIGKKWMGKQYLRTNQLEPTQGGKTRQLCKLSQLGR